MTNYEKLRAKLTEMFMLDRADLDFGIYRIMNSKRDEILRFLDNDLLPQVRKVLEAAQGEIGASGADELKKLETQILSAGMNPDDSPKVQELRAKYSAGGDLTALEQEVFNHLYSFFRRYYDEGDFLSLRRYKEGVYAIPYEGEEVKLHWANADQYYIKTAEHFRDYTFKVGPESAARRVHFKLVDAETEKDNNKASEKRVFILRDEDPIAEVDGELIIRFEYRAAPDRRKQKEHSEESIARILAEAPADWQGLLHAKAPTEKNPNRTVLEKHLTDYTARNTFDYFIHKDLGGFLRRELDFYIKNEVMHLDDIENEAAPKVEQYLAKVRAIRRVAGKLIDFLAQLEDFQKRLWLKKKFVVETQYLVSLDRVPESLFSEIAANEAQRREWVELFDIASITATTNSPGYSESLSSEFLAANRGLLLNTKHFPKHFKDTLLSSLPNHDEQLGATLIKSDNFHALMLLRQKMQRTLTAIHIDPPYNTNTSGFNYKNNYQHSSWLSMMDSRIAASIPLLAENGDFRCHIDENEYESLVKLFERGPLGDAGTIVWDKKNPMLGRRGIATQHEYIIWRSNYPKPIHGLSANVEKVLNLARKAIAEAGGVNDVARRAYATALGSEPGLTGGDRAYRFIDDDGNVFRGVAMGAPEPRQDPKFHIPLLHPVTGRPCPVPPNGWSRTPETLADLVASGDILFGANESTQPQKKVTLNEDSKRQLASVIQETGRGKADLDALGLVFPYCHPVSLYIELIGGGALKADGTVLDYFAGSGTTGHAVIELNRMDLGKRKFLLVEAGHQFDSVLLPRVAKCTYAPSWRNGKPEDRRKPLSTVVKIIRLESYEDVLANLQVAERTGPQQSLVEGSSIASEDYTLRYCLTAETAGSASLLNVESFAHPFSYQLRVATDTVGETKEVNVDLVETFNWLLGLRVHTMDVIRGFHVVTGRLPGPGNSENGEKALIIWRDLDENPNEMLDEFFAKQDYNTRDQEFDVIYVNGDNNLQNLRKDDQTWKVRLIEEEFHRLMWDVEDV